MSGAAVAAMVPNADLTVIDNDPVVVELHAKGKVALDLARSLVVGSLESKAEGMDLVARARRAVKTSESRRIALVKPHNDHVKAVNEFFRLATDPFRMVDTIVSRKVLDYDQVERRRAADAAAEAERKRLESEALLREAEKAEAVGDAPIAEKLLEKAVLSESGATEAQAQAKLPPRVVATESGSVGIRNKPWTFRVVMPPLVPRDFLCIDTAKVREAIRAGERDIPGIEIYQEEGLQVRV